MFHKQEESILNKIKEIFDCAVERDQEIEGILASVNKRLEQLQREKSERLRRNGNIRIYNQESDL